MRKKNILIIAPHPDDETLGCGGTIFKHKKEGDNVFLIIISSVNHKQKIYKCIQK